MDSTNTALLVIDVINSCAHENCEIEKWKITFSKIREMIPSLKEFINEYRATVGGPIIFTTTTPWRKQYLTDNLNELYTDPSARYYSEDTSGFAEEFYQIKPQRDDLVVAKNHYDVFTNDNFVRYLQKHKVHYIVVAGIFGDGCVLASICGGFSKGYNFVILEDLIETTDVPVRQKLLRELKGFTWPMMYGKTLDSKDFIEAWKLKIQDD